MKKCVKRIVSMFLVFAMVIAVAAPGTVQAATKVDKKVTAYVGEAFQGRLFGSTIKSVKSSNSKVVKAEKSSDYKYAYIMTAKKKGTATVTVKYKYGSKSKTYRVKVTVKNVDIEITPQTIDGGYVLFKIKNNTAQSFDKIAFSYSLKDSSGTEVSAKEITCSYVTSKSTAYTTAYVGSSVSVDDSLSTAKVTAVQHDPEYTYKNVTSKQLTVTTTEELSGSSIYLNITSKNKTSKSVVGYNYVLLYDADNNIIGCTDSSIYLTKKETKTRTPSFSVGQYIHPTYDHYEIVTSAYCYYK